MDFIIRFPKIVRQHDFIMVITDMLTKFAHFIPINYTFLDSDVAQIFIRDVGRLHGGPNNIVLDMDAKLTSKFWKESFTALGTNFSFNTAYHS